MKKYLIFALLGGLVLVSGCGNSNSGAVVGSSTTSSDSEVADGAGVGGNPTLPDAGGDTDSGNDTGGTDEAGDTGNGAGTDSSDGAGSTDGAVEGDSGSQLDDLVVTDDMLPPGNLRAVRYSATAGEVFWDALSDADENTRYRIERDGIVLATVSSLSYFTETLQFETVHTMTVYVVAGELRSQSATITFNEQIDPPIAVHEFELGLDRNRVSLDEGNEAGSTFVINIAAQGNETVQLEIQGQRPDDTAGITIELGKSVLSSEESDTSVTFKMPVGMRPIMEQERRFNLIASSGDQVRQAEIILDVKPVNAPDVYLLIGQSNMVGSSKTGLKEVYAGGQDERSDRIWQLNVAPNNKQIFSGFDDFLNESNNAIEPRFIEAEDPLHDPRNPVVQFKGGTTVGPSLTFAKAALASTTQRIYLVPTAWGASGFCNVTGELLAWNAGTSDNSSLGGSGLLERALTRLNMTMRDTGGILRGIIWHQGGADSNDQACADTYAENLRLMVERLRRDAPQDARGPAARGSQAPIPFIVGTQSKGVDDRGDYSKWPSTKTQVDAVQRNISAIVPYADWVNNDDLVPPSYPCGSSSCVHFGATANREIGRRFYEALTRVWSR
ncbi:sialate O-acetylesterase [Granulosicoccus antarcticus]|uniref:Sialate O-acetylesterase domain-containing protein n=1 Tax=Granulosicoccus antarcticus IMCC3135 TaxID=1192854 RepID=A0A2Z2NQ87_9GAMM|nr:sialate O-acetylesterase [Granulosicoccus antarcticus]ASJ70960.1 hypothetical protein IMCC3135_04235 [Granulosicoccus antarcticus IMCC3135]